MSVMDYSQRYHLYDFLDLEAMEEIEVDPSKHVWYIAYDACMHDETFYSHIDRCKDKTRPDHIALPISLNFWMYFTGESTSTYGDGGISVLEPYGNKSCSIGRMYLITKEQLEEIYEFEGGVYGLHSQIMYLGKDHKGIDMYAFTCPVMKSFNAPNEEYLEKIKQGLYQLGVGKSGIAKYIERHTNELEMIDINVCCPRCGETNFVPLAESTLMDSRTAAQYETRLYFCKDCKKAF